MDTGEAFVGDLAMNASPLRLTPGLPIFAEDIEEVKNSWNLLNLLLDKGASKIYPVHGNPFSEEIKIETVQPGYDFLPNPECAERQ